jgi:bifunctional DNA-binding transcriptional regulator/antitoxin component of YhaV-PrlF toxin-antitoxin module
MKATTMTLTAKRQTVFPLAWCRRVGLEGGGPLKILTPREWLSRIPRPQRRLLDLKGK